VAERALTALPCPALLITTTTFLFNAYSSKRLFFSTVQPIGVRPTSGQDSAVQLLVGHSRRDRRLWPSHIARSNLPALAAEHQHACQLHRGLCHELQHTSRHSANANPVLTTARSPMHHHWISFQPQLARCTSSGVTTIRLPSSRLYVLVRVTVELRANNVDTIVMVLVLLLLLLLLLLIGPIGCRNGTPSITRQSSSLPLLCWEGSHRHSDCGVLDQATWQRPGRVCHYP
jgi:hypothetical protein